MPLLYSGGPTGEGGGVRYGYTLDSAKDIK